jgi:hypothetical protein
MPDVNCVKNGEAVAKRGAQIPDVLSMLLEGCMGRRGRIASPSHVRR